MDETNRIEDGPVTTTTAHPSAPSEQTAPQKPQKPVRRVGTLTMGIALIICGILIVLALTMPTIDLTLYFNLCPLLLVFLGIEVVVGALRGDKLKYDFLSMVVCFFVICGSFTAALLPQYIRYYGPEREAIEYRLENKLDALCADTLKGDGRVLACTSRIYLQGIDYDPNVQLEQLDYNAYIDLSITLAGPYETTLQFAEDAAALSQLLRTLGLRYNGFYFSWSSPSGPNHSMMLDMDGSFDENRTPAKLAERVDEYVEETGEAAMQSSDSIGAGFVPEPDEGSDSQGMI